MRHAITLAAFIPLICVCDLSISAPPAAATQVAQEKQVEAERIRWSAAEDMQRLEGQWKLAEPLPEFILRNRYPDYQNPILLAVGKEGAVLTIEDGKFRISVTDIAGTASNSDNDIDFRPINEFWTSNAEPRLRFAHGDQGSMTVSYVASANSMSFRYPANSCSRSGICISLVRVPAEEGKSSPR